MIKRPKIIGIVNITTDSFSDGGQYLAPDAAIAHGRALVAAGADILDLGPASSHPDAGDVSPAEEISRLAPVMDALGQDGTQICVDSFQTETQAFAMQKGAAFLNDIQGFGDPLFYAALAQGTCRMIVMHSIQAKGKATRQRAPEGEIMDLICQFFDTRLQQLCEAGVARDRLILDPGMGFFLGDTHGPSLETLKRLSELKSAFGLPLLVCVSRKSFLRRLTGRDVAGSGAATLAGELFAVLQGADYIRTHDAGALCDVLKVWEALHG